MPRTTPMKLPHIIFLAFMLILTAPCIAAARSLAVFPLLDLSQDENGVNFSLTEYLRKQAVEQGFTVLPEDEVMDFMVRNRIRNLGSLTSYQFSRLRRELKTEYVLLGTVCQLGQKPSARLSLSLQLTRTADEAVVWSVIRDLHEDDLISLLAISDPESLNDLFERYFSTLFDTLPAELTQGEEVAAPSVGILSVNLHAAQVKPGEKMEAEIRVYFSGSSDKPPAFHLLLDGKEYPVDQGGEDARLLKASWLAPDGNGTYPVDLVAVFPSGQRQVQRIAEYTVDGTPPELAVHFVGTVVDDALYFNRNLSIMPLLKIPEVISRWEIAVYDMDQQLLLLQEGSGQIPARIVWNGMLSPNEVAPDGKYRVEVQAWDRAGNLGRFEGEVNLVRAKPELKLEVERKGETVHVLLNNEVQSPLAFWFVKVYEKNGGILLSQVGETLPATLEVKLPGPESDGILELVFAGQDRYGNRTWKKVEDILNLETKKVETEIVPESQWLENF